MCPQMTDGTEGQKHPNLFTPALLQGLSPYDSILYPKILLLLCLFCFVDTGSYSVGLASLILNMQPRLALKSVLSSCFSLLSAWIADLQHNAWLKTLSLIIATRGVKSQHKFGRGCILTITLRPKGTPKCQSWFSLSQTIDHCQRDKSSQTIFFRNL